jgi:hypothetical protein
MTSMNGYHLYKDSDRIYVIMEGTDVDLYYELYSAVAGSQTILPYLPF